jgi:tetratricopeptide (TPR) repeat protein
MRFLLAFCLFFGVFTQASGQGGLDTLGLTGTMADTVVAKKVLKEGRELFNKYHYTEALNKVVQAQGIWKSVMVDEDKLLSDILFLKGMIRGGQGYYEEAISAYDSSLNIRIKILGDRHIEVGKSYNNIGNIYRNLGRYEMSIDCFKKSLSIKIEKIGYNDLSTAMTINNIGNSYVDLAKYDTAIFYLQQSLGIRLKKLGTEAHPDIATSYNSLGVSYYCKGEYNNAIEYYEKDLNVRRMIDELNSPDATNTFNNLGMAWLCCMNLVGSQIFPIPFRPQATFTDLGAAI